MGSGGVVAAGWVGSGVVVWDWLESGAWSRSGQLRYRRRRHPRVRRHHPGRCDQLYGVAGHVRMSYRFAGSRGTKAARAMPTGSANMASARR